MGAVGTATQVFQHFFIDGICAAQKRPHQAAPAHDGVKFLQIHALLLEVVQNQGLAQGGVVLHAADALQILRAVVEHLLQKPGVSLVDGNLGGGGTEVHG